MVKKVETRTYKTGAPRVLITTCFQKLTPNKIYSSCPSKGVPPQKKKYPHEARKKFTHAEQHDLDIRDASNEMNDVWLSMLFELLKKFTFLACIINSAGYKIFRLT